MHFASTKFERGCAGRRGGFGPLSPGAARGDGQMKQRTQSKCPICYSLDMFGDKWTLLIMRDMLIYGKRYYRDFLKGGEGIATNILADRLKAMAESGLIAKADDPAHAGQAIYAPTAKAEALRPTLDAMAAWALRFGPDRLVVPTSTGR